MRASDEDRLMSAFGHLQEKYLAELSGFGPGLNLAVYQNVPRGCRVSPEGNIALANGFSGAL